MKNFILFCAIALTLGSCLNSNPGPSHEEQWSSDGKDSVVYVHQVNQDGSLLNFYMNYLLFRTLFSNGGYTNVTNYYNSHSNEFQRNYTGYSYTNSPTYKSEQLESSKKSYSSPSRSSTSSSSSSSNKSSYSSPSRSSTSSSSYSSPSRSSSSSYSSPSRSSSSSPSRH